ncbi:hypothetical protein JYU34_001267 [Plutella xylostella]|uniref:Chaoptin n=1 Tax=Plutella xylostella TaxID=51655 RepID=A0ABQ7R6F1_PLUXY|nr:hypothetical protein JYU34_001267 [Plutella xylostella]
MAFKLFLALAALIQISNMAYIPPGPAYTCPKETDTHLLFPCVCEKGTDTGIHLLCENTGLAAISVGIGNVAGLGLPIEKLTLRDCKISRLYGSLFHKSTIRVIHIEGSPITSIDMYTFAGVNRTLQELSMYNTKLTEFPKEAFKILGNLTTLRLVDHRITTLGKDIFSGSEAAARLERLHIADGLVSDVSADAFQNLKKLKTLDLHGNRLATLKRSQFKGLRDTEVLDLSYNNITKLDGSHIGDLTKLGWCNASHNNIGEIPRGMFARNTVIKVVHLDNNKIKKLDTNSFRGMRFLRRLYLQDNRISSIGVGTFASVTRIGTVDLARNQITAVHYQMFQQSKYAEIINLAENNITKIETQAFTDLYLAVVNISHNRLEKIEAQSFVNCNNLTVLDLSHNLLTGLPGNAMDGTSYPGELRLEYNFLTDFGQIPIHNMTGIRVLNASHNQIQRIPPKAFPKLYELHTVDLSHNNLSEIANAVFQNLFSLRYLNLSHNSMEQIKPATFGSIPTVLELDLSHNRLRDISRGSLAKFSSCRRLDVSYNSLDKIFQIPISLGELDISYNNLTEIRPNTWPSMNALLSLTLTGNQLSELTSDSLTPLLTLQKVDLSYNMLDRPPWEALSAVSSLRTLYMQHNNLTTLTRSSFGNLPTLFTLDLSHNAISSVATASFKGLQQLQTLSLRANLLDAVPQQTFVSLTALRELDLSQNMLEKIDNKTHGVLDDCLSIEKVNLSHNNFGFLTKKMFPSNPWIPYKLLEVDLSYNSLPVVTFDVTHGTKKLKRLNLSHNSINDVRNNVIGNLTSLEVLDLSYNDLDDLISRTAPDAKVELPENITELYLSHNKLQRLPIDKIVHSHRLRVLDVRNNQLGEFHPGFVKGMKDRNMEVYFEGNYLRCDCFTRPLKHYLNHISIEKIPKIYNLTCTDPPGLQGENILTLDEERLVCAGNIELENKMTEYGNTDKDLAFDFVSEPDLAFRDIQYSQTSIYVHWFVLTTEDVADTFITIKDDKNKLFYSNDVAYNLRSITIAIDKEFQASLEKGGNFDICIQAKNSMGDARLWFPNQCKKVPTDFDSWPKKLSVDKRRLTKKKVKYGWFFTKSSVLGLVSDSILITLCIFLGVCFRRLADFDL